MWLCTTLFPRRSDSTTAHRFCTYVQGGTNGGVRANTASAFFGGGTSGNSMGSTSAESSDNEVDDAAVVEETVASHPLHSDEDLISFSDMDPFALSSSYSSEADSSDADHQQSGGGALRQGGDKVVTEPVGYEPITDAEVRMFCEITLLAHMHPLNLLHTHRSLCVGCFRLSNVCVCVLACRISIYISVYDYCPCIPLGKFATQQPFVLL